MTKEVVLSAGAIGTPQLLMLSGIGNATTLEALGIESIIDLPDVGLNLTDHPILSNYFAVNSTSTNDVIARNATVLTEDLALWNDTHGGPFSRSQSNTIGYLRLPSNASIFDNFSDPSAGEIFPLCCRCH